jgi:hypothetical protein
MAPNKFSSQFVRTLARSFIVLPNKYFIVKTRTGTHIPVPVYFQILPIIHSFLPKNQKAEKISKRLPETTNTPVVSSILHRGSPEIIVFVSRALFGCLGNTSSDPMTETTTPTDSDRRDENGTPLPPSSNDSIVATTTPADNDPRDDNVGDENDGGHEPSIRGTFVLPSVTEVLSVPEEVPSVPEEVPSAPEKVPSVLPYRHHQGGQRSNATTVNTIRLLPHWDVPSTTFQLGSGLNLRPSSGSQSHTVVVRRLQDTDATRIVGFHVDNTTTAETSSHRRAYPPRSAI